MKPIVLLGKGPSAIELHKSDKYDIATVNNTIWLSPEPTYAFFNDVELFALMKDSDFEKVKTIVCPSYLHSHYARLEGVCDNDETHFYELASIFPNRFDHVNFLPYELHTGDNGRPEEVKRVNEGGHPAIALDEWPYSTGGTAAAWLSKYAGYKDFILSGFDPSGGYHPIFVGGGHKDGVKGFKGQGTAEQPQQVYPENYNKMIKFITRYGGKARHINELHEEELKELGLK